MKVGVERLPDITLTFLSPFSYALHHHLELEVAPLWFIPNSTYIQTMRPRKRHSRMPCETNSLKRKGSSNSILTQNQSELTIDAVPVFRLVSRISSDPLRIQTKNQGIHWGANEQPQDWHTTLEMVG